MEQGRSSEENMMNNHQDRQAPPPTQRVNLPENQTPPAHNRLHQPPPPQKCPRCDSPNTKFCYYNNYSLSQPRFFCKSCRRYWTHGGTLRNVPIGGGCRKSKRSKTTSSGSSTSSHEVARTQSVSSSQNLSTGMVSGQSLTPFSQLVVPPVGNSFYTGAATSFLSSLVSMQPAAMNFGGGVNMTSLLQGINLPSLKPQQHFQAQNSFFLPQQSSLIPQRPLSSWTQSFINRNAATSSAVSTGFWGSGGGAGGGDPAGTSSFNPNEWSDNLPGFDPSDQ